MKSTQGKFQPGGAAIAVPVTGGHLRNENSEALAANVQLDLLARLTEASAFIRSEAEQIKAIGITDRSVRLLRILGEAVEEQRHGLEAGQTK